MLVVNWLVVCQRTAGPLGPVLEKSRGPDRLVKTTLVETIAETNWWQLPHLRHIRCVSISENHVSGDLTYHFFLPRNGNGTSIETIVERRIGGV